MKILYLTHFSPWNPKYGAAFRSYGILRGLNQNGDLHVALATKNEGDKIHFLEHADADFKKLYVLEGNGSHKKAFLDLVDQINPEVVWYYTKYALRQVGFPNSSSSVLDFDDLPWHKLRRMARYQQGHKKLLTMVKVIPSWVEDYWVAQRASAVVITNMEELSLTRFGKPVYPVPNGFEFDAELEHQPRGEKRALFFGSLFYYPNLDGIQWFCSEIWPRVLEVVPEAKLDIVGLAEKGLGGLQNVPGVSLHGFVDNLDHFISQSSFLVVPLRIGSGTRIKILEAWSKGLPVVTTTVGAEGLLAQNENTALIGDHVEELAGACIRLFQEPELGAEMARNAFQYGRAQFSWECIYPQLDKVLSAAVRS